MHTIIYVFSKISKLSSTEVPLCTNIHQYFSDNIRMTMLDDISPIYNTGYALLH